MVTSWFICALDRLIDLVIEDTFNFYEEIQQKKKFASLYQS